VPIPVLSSADVPVRFRFVARRQGSRRHGGAHPTYTKILGHAVDVLTEHGFDRFSVQDVLDRADVSRATLYNHFDDVDTLLEAALVAGFAREVEFYGTRLALLVEEASDRLAFRAALRTLLEEFSRLPSIVRYRRAHTITIGATRPVFAASIAAIQDDLTATWARTIRMGQERGFIRSDLDPHDIAVIAQSLAIGRIVDDAAGRQLGDGRWAAVAFAVLDSGFLVPGH